MKKQINSNLLKSLINTEFLILQGKPKLKVKISNITFQTELIVKLTPA